MKRNVFFWPKTIFSIVKTKFWPIYDSWKPLIMKYMKMAQILEFEADSNNFQIMIFSCFLAKSWPKWFFEVGTQLKIVRNSIWVLPNFKKYVKNLFWPIFGQKTSKIQLSNLFYRHDCHE